MPYARAVCRCVIFLGRVSRVAMRARLAATCGRNKAYVSKAVRADAGAGRLGVIRARFFPVSPSLYRYDLGSSPPPDRALPSSPQDLFLSTLGHTSRCDPCLWFLGLSLHKMAILDAVSTKAQRAFFGTGVCDL